MPRWSRDLFERSLAALAQEVGPGPSFDLVCARLGRFLFWEEGDGYDARVNREASRHAAT